MKFGGVHVRLGSLSGDAVEVTAMRGKEGLSRLYRFDIDVVTEFDLLALAPTLLGSSATLTWTTEGDMIVPTLGIVSAISATGIDQRGKRHFSVRLSPRMALLEQRKTSRIFQNRSVVDIVGAVLDVHGISKVWCLAKKYPVRGYCVQYQETDWAFVTRICAEMGIFFYFVHPSLRDIDAGASLDSLTESVVFADDVLHYPPMMTPGVDIATGEAPTDVAAPALSFRPAGGAIEGGEHIEEFEYRRAVRPQSIALRDYDFLRPRLDIDASMHVGSEANDVDNEPLAATPATTTGPLEVYEHHGEYGETDVSQDQARVLLESCRARAIVVKGKGSCRRFSAGRRFRLEGYPHDELEGREFTLVRVIHSYTGAHATGGRDAYSNCFECVPSSVPYRPKKKRRSLSQVLETAEVVGPSGETIYTDSLGRIKVQFHWDRDGLKNDQSSCFMRVSQPWAGASWGVQFIPRIGDEVLVSFIGGDEDRPVVIGSVYNATHPPPFPLPAGKTTSGIRTQSVGGTGQNELAFEDGAGAEVLSVKAARDLREVAGNDHLVEVSRDQTTVVTKSQRVTVGESRSIHVDGDESHSISGTESRVVRGDELVEIAGYRREAIAGSSNSDLHGQNIHNKLSEVRIVEGYSSTTVGSEEKPTGLDVLVYGQESHQATKTLTLGSDAKVDIRCGDAAGHSSITLTPQMIRLQADTIVVRANTKLTLLTDGPGIELEQGVEVLGNTIKLFSEGGSVELDASAAHVDGPVVKLNCGAGDAPKIDDEEDNPSFKLLKWRCLDANLKPYKGTTYRLVAQGIRFKGQTDEDGYVQELVPEDAVVADLTVWIESYPEGARLRRTIRLDDIPASALAYGAMIRLRNLGYYTGPETDELTPELSNALREFQHDHKIAESGEIDAATTDKLDEVHPS